MTMELYVPEPTKTGLWHYAHGAWKPVGWVGCEIIHVAVDPTNPDRVIVTFQLPTPAPS